MTGPDTIGDVLLLENFGLNIGKLAFKGIPELFEGLKGIGVACGQARSADGTRAAAAVGECHLKDGDEIEPRSSRKISIPVYDAHFRYA